MKSIDFVFVGSGEVCFWVDEWYDRGVLGRVIGWYIGGIKVGRD